MSQKRNSNVEDLNSVYSSQVSPQGTHGTNEYENEMNMDQYNRTKPIMNKQDSLMNITGGGNGGRRLTDSSASNVKGNNDLRKGSFSSTESSRQLHYNINDNMIDDHKKSLEPIMEAPPIEKIVKKPNVYEFYINNSECNVQELFFKDNKISTTKYNIFTFLPKALFYQLMRLANVYFIFIAVLQSIPIISPLGAATAIAPLVFVFTVSLIREGIEDCQRARLDKEQNSDLIEVYRNGKWTTVPSGELQMGEIVQVKNEGIFPADLFLLDSNLNDGICFIETGSLDGEKTLKIKGSPNFTKGKFNKASEINLNANNITIHKRGNDLYGSTSLSKTGTNASDFDKKKKKKKRKISSSSRRDLRGFDEHRLSKDCRSIISGSVDYNSNTNNYNSKGNYGAANNNNTPNPNNNTVNPNGEKIEKADNFVIEGTMQCDMPNPSLYMLNGRTNMKVNGIGNEFPLDAKNLLLKGARLKNTDWVIGIIIYTGHNCKIMKNAKDPIQKMSSVEKLLNKLLVGILGVQIVLSIISCICHSSLFKKDKAMIIQSDKMKPADYDNSAWMDFLAMSLPIDSLLSFFTYLLLLNTLIPVSLVITLEIAKVVQGLFIIVDVDGFSHYRQKFITTNSVSLNEELGTVDYIFSDKTGTLTCNKMNLKFCVIGEQCFEYIRKGLNSSEIELNRSLREKEKIVPFEDFDMLKSSSIKNSNRLNLDQNQNNPKILPSLKYQDYMVSSSQKSNVCIYLDTTERIIEEYWKALALCHDCNIQNGEYIGMSPDNLELVKSASLQGFKFDASPSSSHFVITYTLKKTEDPDEIKESQKFENLNKIEFSSDRKRESILVKEGGLYKLYIKGADSVIEERLSKTTPPEVLNKARHFVNLFSAQGYRTLFIAMKILTEEESSDYLSEVEQAEMDTEHKKKRLEEAYASVEKDLTLLGATIVEDKLQENVPEVIKELRQADIKIWMLTGDKLSTAYNIGLSCNLISTNLKTFFIEGKEKQFDENLKLINKDEREQVIINFVKEYNHFIGDVENGFMESKQQQKKFGILVDEKALLTITENDEIAKMFLSVAKEAVAVICCRVSPLQKSQVVKLMKNYDNSKITLAIGDGGNDVSMIMEAHIGIGIYGEEGLRAAQSSDYAIGEFQVLKRLLFFHGYMNLMRNSIMVIYFFYKNFVFTIIHFFFGFICGFSGQTIIDDWFITLYNLVFTSIPLGARGILDISFRPEDGTLVKLLLPYLYKEQRDFPIFNLKKIILNLFKGIIHALINYFITLYTVSNILGDDGSNSNLWTISVTLYTNILLIVSLDMIIFTKYHTIINWLTIVILTFVLYILFLVIVQRVTLFNSVGAIHDTFNAGLVWFILLQVVCFCAIIDYVILAFNTLFKQNIHHQLQLLPDKNDTSLEYIQKMPSPIKEILLKKCYEQKDEEIKPEKMPDAFNINNIKEQDNNPNMKQMGENAILNTDRNVANKVVKKKKRRKQKRKEKEANSINNNNVENNNNVNGNINKPIIIKNPEEVKQGEEDNIRKDDGMTNNTNNNNITGQALFETNNKFKNHSRPFNNINFGQKQGFQRNYNNAFGEGSSYMSKDQTDRRLLKANFGS